MELLYFIISTVLIFFAFLSGLYYGSKVKSNETINKPKMNPIKIVKEHIDEFKENDKNKLEQKIEETNLYNIDNYDGTGLGQREIPR